MLFHKLKIGLKNFDKQRHFYHDALGFELSSKGSSELIIQAGRTELVLSKEVTAPALYHFCFLIPTGSLAASIDLLESKGIDLLPFKGEKVVQFDTGQSIYFFDPDGNIAEFIERPLLNYPTKNTFEIKEVLCVNEIGHPVADPMETSQKLMTDHGIQPINHKTWNDKFCWVGDHEGAIIVVKNGRAWMPTDIPGVCNDFELEYTSMGKTHQLKMVGGHIIPS